MSARHPPTSAEGQAALAHAAREYLAAIHAPLLGALLRRRLAEITGLPEAQLQALLPASPPPPSMASPAAAAQRDPQRPWRPRGAIRRAPSLAQSLLQALLLKPSLATTIDIPEPDDGSTEGSALAAVVALVKASREAPSTQAVVQQMLGTRHEDAIRAALPGSEDGTMSDEQAEAQLRDGAARWIEQRRNRETGRMMNAPLHEMSAEEKEALRQRLMPPRQA